MVGKRGQRNADYTPEAFWKDTEHEYAGKILFCQL